MGRALCFNAVEDGPSFLFEPTAPVLVNDQACSLETELYLSGPEAMTSSRHPSSGAAGPVGDSDGAPRDPMAYSDPQCDDVVPGIAVPAEDFVAAFRRPLEQPVLLCTPRRRTTKAPHNDDDDVDFDDDDDENDDACLAKPQAGLKSQAVEVAQAVDLCPDECGSGKTSP
jgi:hypothetical protein